LSDGKARKELGYAGRVTRFAGLEEMRRFPLGARNLSMKEI
jgi:hypothetical protein